MHIGFHWLSIVVLCFVSFHAQSKSAAKTKAQKKSAPITTSLLETAKREIAVDPKKLEAYTSSPQNTGILVLKGTDLRPDHNPARFPVGIHFDSMSLAGQAVASNKYNYRFSDLGSPLISSLKLGMLPSSPVFFDAFNMQLGIQQKSFSYSAAQSLRLTHYYATLAGEKKLYERSRWDVRLLTALGIMQTQISSPENSLANVTRKTNFLGLGLQTQYQVMDSLNADLGATYNYAFAASEDYKLGTVGFGAGLSYIW